jgi:hypothetical protein
VEQPDAGLARLDGLRTRQIIQWVAHGRSPVEREVPIIVGLSTVT